MGVLAVHRSRRMRLSSTLVIPSASAGRATSPSRYRTHYGTCGDPYQQISDVERAGSPVRAIESFSKKRSTPLDPVSEPVRTEKRCCGQRDIPNQGNSPRFGEDRCLYPAAGTKLDDSCKSDPAGKSGMNERGIWRFEEDALREMSTCFARRVARYGAGRRELAPGGQHHGQL